MKKTFLLLMVVIITLSVCGCNHVNKNLNNDVSKKAVVAEESDICTVPIFSSLKDIYEVNTDIFTAKIISEQEIDSDIYFPNYVNRYATPKLYTVEVIKSLRTLTAMEGNIVQVVHYVKGEEYITSESRYWSDDFEIGKTYLILGPVQPYFEKAVICDMSVITAAIESDGSFTPMSKQSKSLLSGVETFDDFINNKDVISALEQEINHIPPTFFQILEPKNKDAILPLLPEGQEIEPVEEYNYSTGFSKAQKDVIQTVLIEAVKADSKIKLNLDVVY